MQYEENRIFYWENNGNHTDRLADIGQNFAGDGGRSGNTGAPDNYRF